MRPHRAPDDELEPGTTTTWDCKAVDWLAGPKLELCSLAKDPAPAPEPTAGAPKAGEGSPKAGEGTASRGKRRGKRGGR